MSPTYVARGLRDATRQRESPLSPITHASTGSGPSQTPAAPPTQVDLSGLVQAVDNLSTAVNNQATALRAATNRTTVALNNPTDIHRQGTNAQANVPNNAFANDLLGLMTRLNVQPEDLYVNPWVDS